VKVGVQKVILQTPDTRTVRLDRTIDFRAGQAVKIQFPGDSQGRFFSISSSPTEKPYLDVTVKAKDGNPLAPILSRLSSGASVDLDGPFGSFSLPNPIKESLCFIAAGSGVTVFRSMVHTLLENHASTESWLLHSVKTPADLIFHDEFVSWESSNSKFHYVPTVTQHEGTRWTKETGRINDVLIRKHIADRPCSYLLCGPPPFVGDMEKLLTGTLRISPGHVRREQW